MGQKDKSTAKLTASKAEQVCVREIEEAKLALKKKFYSEREVLALDLFLALDKHVADSQISTMSASTGGVKVIWSKTLRSTAGRANWKRTLTKLSPSAVKENLSIRSIKQQPGVTVQHHASIELAEKIIDRPERLVNTLAHEFCHLANFMVSNVRDQPHGESFKRWGNQVTSWLHSPAAARLPSYREEWKMAEVVTKHSYVVDTKYLWVCIGQPAERGSLSTEMLNAEVEDEEGCGAEYGRHSRSIDVKKQRCKRCKGLLKQVRPILRAGGKSSTKKPWLRKEESNSVEELEKLMGTIELSG
ncbi:hypothetical protein H2198_006771 [Neophaeococcomyces mojaviensis]|uniref:Uncharacterized protein n=1 Tax=Neophaeococcomyces mojaviensis TaxID=3383035 RepID=A0ACC3A2E9_9EURO|nr:hypothetical protein H2198_006771 [Knufia sp. JES_112]